VTKSITESLNALIDALPQRPDQAVIDRLRTDLSVVSSQLLSGAIQEIAATAKKKLPEEPAEGDIRDAIYRIYNRKVAEHAQMFPMFHTVETALRASLAVELETHYGIQGWWNPVLKGLMSSAWDPRSVTRIGNVDINREIPYRMGRILQSLIDKKVAVDKQVPYTPRSKYNVGLIMGSGTLLVRHVGGRFADSQNTIELPAYTVVDLRLARPLFGAEATFAVNNVFDEQYSEAFGLDPNTYAMRKYPMPRRNYSLGVKWVF